MVVFGAVNPQADFESFKKRDLILLLVMEGLSVWMKRPGICAGNK